MSSVPAAFAELRKRHSRQAIAQAAGVTSGMVNHWEHGTHVPGVERAVRIDELLGARGLIEAVTAARTRTCKVCPRAFVTTERSAKSLYCSRDCKRKANTKANRVFRTTSTHRHAMRLTMRLRSARASNVRLRTAIDGICAPCPEGPVVCGNGECAAHEVTRRVCVVKGCTVNHRRNAA